MFRAIILWDVAEYCDCSSKLTIKLKDKQVRIELWSSSSKDVTVTTDSYSSKRIAYNKYRLAIGDAILGGWKVLNLYPKRETWETNRSK